MLGRTLKSWRRGGFSLMEMLMVIVIIATLLTIGLVGAANFRRDARLKQVKTVLDVCRAAATEYQAATGLVINHSAFDPDKANSTDVKPFDWKKLAEDDSNLAPLNEAKEKNDKPDDVNAVTHVYIERFVWAVSQVPSAYKMLGGEKTAEETDKNKQMQRLSRFLVDTDGDGFYEIVDPFGNPLAYAAFVNHKDEIKKDDYLPEHDKPFFASPGMDGKWGEARTEEELKGEWGTYADSPKGADAKDNIYSFINE